MAQVNKKPMKFPYANSDFCSQQLNEKMFSDFDAAFINNEFPHFQVYKFIYDQCNVTFIGNYFHWLLEKNQIPIENRYFEPGFLYTVLENYRFNSTFSVNESEILGYRIKNLDEKETIAKEKLFLQYSASSVWKVYERILYSINNTMALNDKTHVYNDLYELKNGNTITIAGQSDLFGFVVVDGEKEINYADKMISVYHSINENNWNEYANQFGFLLPTRITNPKGDQRFINRNAISYVLKNMRLRQRAIFDRPIDFDYIEDSLPGSKNYDVYSNYITSRELATLINPQLVGITNWNDENTLIDLIKKSIVPTF